jgi:restriction system protein
MPEFAYNYDDLFNPTLRALYSLGGSATGSELLDEVSTVLNLDEDEINDIHRGNRTNKRAYNYYDQFMSGKENPE